MRTGLEHLEEKVARVKTPLQPHQQRLVDRLQSDDQPGLVAIHGLGSGKTLAALAAQDALGAQGTYIVPAALQENLHKEQSKHIQNPQHSDIVSMQNMAVKQKPLTTDYLAVDEAHRARDPQSATFQALKQTKANKRLLLTGSPFYNKPADIAPLIDLAAHGEVLPLDEQKFNDRYVTQRMTNPGLLARLRGVQPGMTPGLNPERANELRRVFRKWTDFHPGSMDGFPTVTHQDVRVPMSQKQLGVYDSMLDETPYWVRHKVLNDLPPSQQEAKQMGAFLTGARQSSNTTAPFAGADAQSPKIDEAFKHLQAQMAKDPSSKAVIYSNFLDAGINPYKAKLQQAGIPFGEFTGEMPEAERNELVKQYNDNKLKALLLSSAGGEGLDLKGTRLLQLLEPHWNNEKLRQVEGRGARYQSHSGMSPEQQNMLIERYYSTRPRSGLLERLHLRKPGKSVDEYLANRSQEKDDLINQFRSLLPREASG